jgi:pimeloyl-ACP methyl ester carboxylesterase
MDRYIFILTIILLIIIISYVYINWLRYGSLFVPTNNFKNKSLITPKNLKNYNDFYVKTQDNCLLHGWFYACPKNKTGETVLLCHGNTGNISYRDFLIEICSTFKLNAILFDYRGYGKSSGFPSQEKINEDGQTIYNWAVNEKQIDPNNIIIWGESLGGSVATYLASKNTCKSLVLLATFSSLYDIVWQTLNIFEKSILTYIFLCIDPMETKKRIREVKCPVIIIHSPNDGFIPYENAVILHSNVLHENKHLITIEGTHTSPKINSMKMIEVMNLMCCRDLDVSQSLTILNNVLEEVSKPADFQGIMKDYNQRFTFFSKGLINLPPLV